MTIKYLQWHSIQSPFCTSIDTSLSTHPDEQRQWWIRKSNVTNVCSATARWLRGSCCCCCCVSSPSSSFLPFPRLLSRRASTVRARLELMTGLTQIEFYLFLFLFREQQQQSFSLRRCNQSVIFVSFGAHQSFSLHTRHIFLIIRIENCKTHSHVHTQSSSQCKEKERN